MVINNYNTSNTISYFTQKEFIMFIDYNLYKSKFIKDNHYSHFNNKTSIIYMSPYMEDVIRVGLKKYDAEKVIACLTKHYNEALLKEANRKNC